MNIGYKFLFYHFMHGKIYNIDKELVNSSYLFLAVRNA